MKLRNKKTGEIVEAHEIDLIDNYVYLRIFRAGDYDTKQYNSLAELNKEWEDYEELKVFWYIEGDGDIHHIRTELCDELEIHTMKQIGNYFETKEEAEKAVEKLKAWKRLKDKGFRFGGHDDRDRGQLGDIVIYAEMPTFEYDDDSTRDDLDLLFGGEE